MSSPEAVGVMCQSTMIVVSLWCNLDISQRSLTGGLSATPRTPLHLNLPYGWCDVTTLGV